MNQEEPVRVHQGGRGVAEQAALLRRLDSEGKLRYLRQEGPTTGHPRQYVIDCGRGEVRLLGRELRSWVEGYELGWTARGDKGAI